MNAVDVYTAPPGLVVSHEWAMGGETFSLMTQAEYDAESQPPSLPAGSAPGK